jgi:hypothetical protein
MKKKKQKVKTKGREIEKKILTVHGSYNIYSVFKKKNETHPKDERSKKL